MLRLVRDHDREGDAREQRAIPRERAVTRDHKVQAGDFRGRAEPSRAVVNEDFQLRGEARGLAPPILEQRSGANHERRAAAARGRGGEQREGLRGFSQAHLIGEDATEAVGAQVPEPGDTEPLIRAQLAVERGGERGRLQPGQVAQRGSAPPPGLGRLVARRNLLQQCGNLGRARRGQTLDAAGSERRIRVANKFPLGRRQGPNLLGIQQDNLSAVFRISPVGGDGCPERRFGRGVRLQPERHLEAVPGCGDLRGDGGGLQVCGA